ncbi:hypothetical protein Tco_1318538 [Tanacetum coccineum]
MADYYSVHPTRGLWMRAQIFVPTNSQLSHMELKHKIASAVASAVTRAMTAMFKQQQQVTPAPASVKAVEESCVTCGEAHSYRQCPATDGNTFMGYHDNIQGYISAATAVNNNNQGYRS